MSDGTGETGLKLGQSEKVLEKRVKELEEGLRMAALHLAMAAVVVIEDYQDGALGKQLNDWAKEARSIWRTDDRDQDHGHQSGS